MQLPIVEELSTELSGKANIAKINVDEEPEIASQFGVMISMYTFMFDYTFWANECPHFDYHGNLDLAITIRTLVYANGRAYWGVGAGIVADSDPGAEWDETMNKGRALWMAVQRAERGAR